MGKAVVRPKIGSIIMCIFSLPFIGVGLAAFCYGFFAPIQLERNSKSWPQVEAIISHLEYSKELEYQGDVPLNFEFTYTYENESYTGNSIYLDNDAPKDLEEDKELFKIFNDSLSNNSTIPLYVDPEDPSFSTYKNELYEKPHIFLVVTAAFGGMGALALFFGVYSLRGDIHKEKKEIQHKNQPWKWQKKWQDGIITPARSKNLIIGFIFIIFWWGMTATVAVVAYDEVTKAGLIFYVCLGMGSIGLISIFFYIRSVFRFMKYGKSKLVLKTFPGEIGKTLEAEVFAPFILNPEEDIYTILRCDYHYTTGRGDDRRTKTVRKWDHHYYISLNDTKIVNDKLVIPVKFELPSDVPESANDMTWSLGIYAKTPGLDWNEEYSVPVFKVSEKTK